MNRHYAAALLLLGVAACAKPETAEQVNARMANEAATARAAIAENNARWSRYLAAGQADSIGSLYHANTRVRPMDEAALNGREAVINSFAPMMQLGTWHITLSTDSVWANGPLIVETGSWTMHLAVGRGVTLPPGVDTTGSGAYMARWVKEGDQYLMADDVYNSNRPRVPAPPARRG